MLAALISNLVRGKGTAPAKTSDFMPGDIEQQEPEDPWEAFKRITNG